jgi:DNA-binding Lrp family transcriptional regulator
MKMTITQYAETLKLKRNAIHKRIKEATKKGVKPNLPGVTKIERLGKLTILHVKEAQNGEA